MSINTARDTEENVCTGFRIAYGHGQASGCDAGIGAVYDATLVGLAMALDDCADEYAQLRGSYGSLGHGGCWVEASFGGEPGDADTEAERINDLSQAARICGELPFGSRKQARQFLSGQRQNTVWDGNSHRACSTSHTTELLERY